MNRAQIRARLRADADWYAISNAAGDGGKPAEVVIYDEIGWFGTTAADFMDQVRGITADRIDLRLNSPGGDVFDGIAIHNVLRSHPAAVTTYVDSLAASVASVIALAGDRVVMQPHSQMMVHDAWGVAVGNAATMTEMADLLDRQSDNIAAVYAERAGGKQGDWRDVMRAETWYTAQEAVDAGLAHEVAKLPRKTDTGTDDGAADKKPANRWDLSVFAYEGREHAPAPDLSRPVDHVDPEPEPDDVAEAEASSEPDVAPAVTVLHHANSALTA
jgi:ATP-dependent protease ClpP protease subunit